MERCVSYFTLRWLSKKCMRTEKGPSLHFWLGQVSRAGLTSRYSTLPLCITGRAEHFLLTSIVNYSWRVIFWTRPAATFGDLLICAKDLFVGAKTGGLRIDRAHAGHR